MASKNGMEGWKNPKDIMRVHRIHRRSKSTQKAADSSPMNNQPESCGTFKPDLLNSGKVPRVDAPKKRTNPFMREKEMPAKKHLKTGNSQSEDDQSFVSSWTTVINEKTTTSGTQSSPSTGVDECNHQEKQQGNVQTGPTLSEKVEDVLSEFPDSAQGGNVLHSSVSCNPKSENTQDVRSSLPVDWSLKLKMRVVTNVEINPREKYIGLEARNLQGFVDSQFDEEEWRAMDAVCQIRRCCHHYSFPSIPGFRNFPRLSSHCENKPSPCDTTRQPVLDALQSEWSKAFISVYQQLRSSLCPYFYLCCHQFNVLFQCLRSSDRCTLTAILSPTTRGFRELLKKEGVSFQMPRVKQPIKEAKGDKSKVSPGGTPISRESRSARKPASQGGSQIDDRNSHGLDSTGGHLEKNSVTSEEDDFESAKNRVDGNDMPKEEDDDDDEDDDDGFDSNEDGAASSWLEEIGLESKHFPSLLPQNVKVQKERFQEIDNRLQSVICMEGLDVHAFFNFLINYPSCTANSGPQYGIPPTILSPRPFQGGTLTVNNVKQSSIQDVQSGRSSEASSHCSERKSLVLEINGPILPHHVLNVAAIIRSKATSSSMSFSVHQPSTAFDTALPDNPESNVLLSGMRKLLVPLSSLKLGLLSEVEGSLLSKECRSLKEVGVEKRGYICTS